MSNLHFGIFSRRLSLIVTLIGTCSTGLPSKAAPLDLVALDTLMLENDQDIYRAALSLDRIEAQLASVHAGYRPKATFRSSNQATSKREYNVTEHYHGSSHGLSIEQPILDGVLLLEDDRLKSLTVAQRAALESTIQSRRLLLLQELGQLMSATAEYDLVQDQARHVNEKYAAVTRLVDANQATRIDLLLIEAEKYRVNARLVDVASSIEIKKAAIKSITGKLDTQLSVTFLVDPKVWPFDNESFESLFKNPSRHPNEIIRDARLKSAFIKVRQASRSVWPTVVGTASITRANTNSDFNTTAMRDVQTVGLSLQWTIFDSGRQAAKEAEAVIDAKDASAALEQAVRNVKQQNIRSLAALKAARASWEAAGHEVEIAHELLRVSVKKSEQGVGTVTEELLAVERLTNAKIRLNRSWTQGFISAATRLADFGALRSNAIEELARLTGRKQSDR